MANKLRRPPPLEVPQEETPKLLISTKSSDTFVYEYEVSPDELVVLRELGRGSSAVVHQVVHPLTGKFFARKRIIMQEDPSNIIKELQLTGKCQHENVVKMYGAFMRDGRVEMILDYMDFGTLQDLMEMSGPLPEPVIAAISTGVLKGLQYLHSNVHLIHRDMKPSNILINMKVADLGVGAQLMNTAASAGSWVGTVTYMAPDRIMGEVHYHIDSDIWSFGLCVAESLMGRFPYPPQGEEAEPLEFFTLLSYIVDNPPPRLDTRRNDPLACDFVARMLEKEHTRRARAGELLSHPFLKKHEKFDFVSWLNNLISSSNDAIHSTPMSHGRQSHNTSRNLSTRSQLVPISHVHATGSRGMSPLGGGGEFHPELK